MYSLFKTREQMTKMKFPPFIQLCIVKIQMLPANMNKRKKKKNTILSSCITQEGISCGNYMQDAKQKNTPASSP